MSVLTAQEVMDIIPNRYPISLSIKLRNLFQVKRLLLLKM